MTGTRKNPLARIAEELAAGAARARLTGDDVASLHMGNMAAQYLQLAKALGVSAQREEKA